MNGVAVSVEPDLSEFEELTEVEQLRQLNGKLQDRLKKSKAKTSELIAAVREGAQDAALTMGNPPAVPKPKADRRKGKTEVALLHLSDLHFGKQTESFDSEIAAQRIERLIEKVILLTEIERADHPVRECHVMLGGDFVENVGIFPGQAFEVDSTLFSQIFAARNSVSAALRKLASVFEVVTTWEEPGNHGRLGRKGDHPQEDSADLLTYRLARERVSDLEDSGRIVWNETQGWHSIVTIGNYPALLVHGDEIKSFGGNIPAFGISRKVNAWSTGVVAPFTDCYMGHFHAPMMLPLAHGRGRIFVNPSIESGSVYAQEFMASTGTPGQRLNFVEPEKGRVTSERLIWLD
jgi:hypothetical protein